MISYDILNNLLLYSGVFGGILATFWGIYLGWKRVTGKDEEKLEKVRQELVTNLEKSREEWKSKFELEQIAHTKTRDFWHEKAKEDQTILAKLNEENQNLKAKTNVLPIIDALKAVTVGMERITIVVERMEKRLDILEQKP